MRTGTVQVRAGEKQSAESNCVVWVRAGQAPPTDLIGSLARHGARVETCSDQYSALARAACGAGGSGASGRVRGAIVVLVEPRQLPEAAAFVEAARRYAPRAALWWFDSTMRPMLRAVVAEDVHAWRGGLPRQSPAQPTPPPAAASTAPAVTRPVLSPPVPNTAPWIGPNPVPPRSAHIPPEAPRLRLAPAPPMPSRTPAPGVASESNGQRVEMKSRRAEDDVDHRTTAHAAQESDHRSMHDLLTAEELSMLLGEMGPMDDDLPPPPSGGPGVSGGHA